MKKDAKFYFKLFMSTFTLSAFTFGGGYVIVPLMRKKFVENYHWIEEEEMMDFIAMAQSAPGPMAVNTSILVGYHMAGIPGACLTILGTVLPPLIILSVVSLFYTAFRDSAAVAAVLKGMQAGVAAVIIDVVISMGQKVLKGKSVKKGLLTLALMIAAFVATFFLDVNAALIILAFILGSTIATYIGMRKAKEAEK